MTNYKIIITEKNGHHRFVRGAYDLVANFVSKFSEGRNSMFKAEIHSEYYGEKVDFNQIQSARILNEYTHELLLQL